MVSIPRKPTRRVRLGERPGEVFESNQGALLSKSRTNANANNALPQAMPMSVDRVGKVLRRWRKTAEHSQKPLTKNIDKANSTEMPT